MMVFGKSTYIEWTNEWLDGCCCTRQAKNSIYLNDNDNFGKRSTKKTQKYYLLYACAVATAAGGDFLNAIFAVVIPTPTPIQFTKTLLTSETVYDCIVYNYNDLQNDSKKESTTLCW